MQIQNVAALLQIKSVCLFWMVLAYFLGVVSCCIPAALIRFMKLHHLNCKRGSKRKSRILWNCNKASRTNTKIVSLVS